jgi:hypothetical protein
MLQTKGDTIPESSKTSVKALMLKYHNADFHERRMWITSSSFDTVDSENVSDKESQNLIQKLQSY